MRRTLAIVTGRGLRWGLTALVGGLLLTLAAGQIEHGIGAIIQRDEVMYGEAIVYDQAARLLRGQPLYQPLNQAPYTVTAYTPVYYWLVAELHAVVGPGFGPGRVASLVAGLVAALLVADLAARRARSAWAGLFAAALFLALSFPTQGPGLEYAWFSFYKEDMLGVTFALGAIAVLDRGASRKGVVVAGVLAALAVLTKQTLFAAGVAGFVWLLLRDRRLAALFGTVAVGLVVIASVALELSTHAFLANVVFANVNPLNEYVFMLNLGVLLRFQVVPLALAAVYLVARLRDWRKAVCDIMVPYALASLVTLIGLAKIGANYNYWIDLGAITAVLATQVIWGGLRAGPVPAAFVAVAAVAVLGAHLAVFLRDAQPSMDLLGILPAEQQRDLREPTEFDWVVERVREEPREVLSEALDVVVLAGKRTEVEPIIFTIMVDGNQWDDGPLVRRICAGDVGLVLIKGPLEGGTPDQEYVRGALWPPRVLEALRETMQFETRQAGLSLYSPGNSTTPRPAC
jgi:hypothetical protein